MARGATTSRGRSRSRSRSRTSAALVYRVRTHALILAMPTTPRAPAGLANECASKQQRNGTGATAPARHKRHRRYRATPTIFEVFWGLLSDTNYCPGLAARAHAAEAPAESSSGVCLFPVAFTPCITVIITGPTSPGSTQRRATCRARAVA
jgi:hypothetical protein